MNLTGFLWAASLTSSILSPQSSAEALPPLPESMPSSSEPSVGAPAILHRPLLNLPFAFVRNFCHATATQAAGICLSKAGLPKRYGAFLALSQSVIADTTTQGLPEQKSGSASNQPTAASAPGAVSAGFISSGLVSSSLLAAQLGETAVLDPFGSAGSAASRLAADGKADPLNREKPKGLTGLLPPLDSSLAHTDVRWVSRASGYAASDDRRELGSACTDVRAGSQADSRDLSSSDQGALAPSCQSPQFQIWLQDTFILTVTERDRAYWIGQNLDQALQTGDLEPTALQLRQVGDALVGQAGSHNLFEVNRDLADQLGQNQELLAIQGLNNLRSALGTNPKPVAVAQADLHRLSPTDDAIEGTASWYGPYFHGQLTATGEVFDQNELTAAHPSLPFDTFLEVTNLQNGEAVIVRVNDRGPYVGDRSLDLSRAAARHLGAEQTGLMTYRATIMAQQSGSGQ